VLLEEMLASKESNQSACYLLFKAGGRCYKIEQRGETKDVDLLPNTPHYRYPFLEIHQALLDGTLDNTCKGADLAGRF